MKKVKKVVIWAKKVSCGLSAVAEESRSDDLAFRPHKSNIRLEKLAPFLSSHKEDRVVGYPISAVLLWQWRMKNSNLNPIFAQRKLSFIAVLDFDISIIEQIEILFKIHSYC